jgi:hypothetical protein
MYLTSVYVQVTILLYFCFSFTCVLFPFPINGYFYFRPMLCVSDVNPFQFAEVPALLNTMSIRKKIPVMLPCVQCPFRNFVIRVPGI